MRKEVYSASLADEHVAMLRLIAKREMGGNASAALRAIIEEAARGRGVLIAPLRAVGKQEAVREQTA